MRNSKTAGNNKRIALVVNTLSSGGAEHVVANLSRSLSDTYDVDIIVNDDQNIQYHYAGNVISLGMPPDANRIAAGYQVQTLKRRTSLLKKLKRSGRYKAIISFSDNTNLSNVLSITKEDKGCRTIISIRYSLKGREKTEDTVSIVSRAVLRWCCRMADAVVSCSMEIADNLMMDYGLDSANATVIYNGVEERIIQEAEKTGPKTIVTIGRMTRQKGQWHLLRAVGYMRNKGLDVRLIILGDGEMRSRLKEMSVSLGIDDEVQMPGRVDDPDVYLRKADLAVYPSLYEGLSNAVLETLACGVPCISTDHSSGAREILAPNTDYRNKVTDHIDFAEFGVLVPVCDGSPDEKDLPLSKEEKLLAQAIEKVLTDDERSSYYREAGPKRAADFNMKDISRKWINLIETGNRHGND